MKTNKKMCNISMPLKIERCCICGRNRNRIGMINVGPERWICEKCYSACEKNEEQEMP